MKKPSDKTKIKKIDTKAETPPSTFLDNNKVIFFLLGIAMLFILIARMHLLSIPFERDEGEYAYMGQLILDGHPPYTLAYNMKFPGTYYMYALIMLVFGETITGVHLGLAIIVIASMYLVFSISRNFVSKIASVISAASYGILATNWTLLAHAGHATHFVSFFALLGIYVLFQLYKSEKPRLFNYFISGVFLCLAFICKQSGIFFLFFGLSLIITKEFQHKPILRLLRNLTVFFTGFSVPFIVMLLYFYFLSDFNKFWFWTVEYLSKYGSQLSVSEAPGMFKQTVIAITANYSSLGYIALWIVSLLGIPCIFINNASAQNKIILISFLFFSFLTVVPGFYFRQHYFITLLPAAAMSVAVFFEYINSIIINKIKMPNLVYVSFLVFLVLIGTGIKANTIYLFIQNPDKSCKMIYGTSPFVESIKISEFLKRNTSKDDKIAVLGSEPQIFFYANRYSATGYIYTYNLVEVHTYALSMQKEMAKEITANDPKYILFVHIGASWALKPKSESYIFKWANDYLHKKYKLVALLDVMPNRFSPLKVREEMDNYQLQSKEYIYIYEKNQ